MFSGTHQKSSPSNQGGKTKEENCMGSRGGKRNSQDDSEEESWITGLERKPTHTGTEEASGESLQVDMKMMAYLIYVNMQKVVLHF